VPSTIAGDAETASPGVNDHASASESTLLASIVESCAANG
jgi:hypothetical protein